MGGENQAAWGSQGTEEKIGGAEEEGEGVATEEERGAQDDVKVR